MDSISDYAPFRADRRWGLIVLFEGNRLVALLAVWIFGLLGIAISAGMLLQQWVLGQRVLSSSFWSAMFIIVIGFISLVRTLRRYLIEKP